MRWRMIDDDTIITNNKEETGHALRKQPKNADLSGWNNKIIYVATAIGIIIL